MSESAATDRQIWRERDGWMRWSYPQVVFAAECLQQLLVVSVTHLSQECQQTRHKLSLVKQHTHISKRKVCTFSIGNRKGSLRFIQSTERLY